MKLSLRKVGGKARGRYKKKLIYKSQKSISDGNGHCQPRTKQKSKKIKNINNLAKHGESQLIKAFPPGQDAVPANEAPNA